MDCTYVTDTATSKKSKKNRLDASNAKDGTTSPKIALKKKINAETAPTLTKPVTAQPLQIRDACLAKPTIM